MARVRWARIQAYDRAVVVLREEAVGMAGKAETVRERIIAEQMAWVAGSLERHVALMRTHKRGERRKRASGENT